MKALFKSHFPFVEGTPEDQLTKEQLLIKQTYDKLYPDTNFSANPDITQESGQDKTAKVKGNKLREVRGNDLETGRES